MLAHVSATRPHPDGVDARARSQRGLFAIPFGARSACCRGCRVPIASEACVAAFRASVPPYTKFSSTLLVPGVPGWPGIAARPALQPQEIRAISLIRSPVFNPLRLAQQAEDGLLDVVRLRKHGAGSRDTQACLYEIRDLGGSIHTNDVGVG